MNKIKNAIYKLKVIFGLADEKRERWRVTSADSFKANPGTLTIRSERYSIRKIDSVYFWPLLNMDGVDMMIRLNPKNRGPIKEIYAGTFSTDGMPLIQVKEMLKELNIPTA